MTDELDPQDETTTAYRSLSMTLIQAGEVIGAGAASGATNALVSNWLQGDKRADPPPPHVELPPGVHVDD